MSQQFTWTTLDEKIQKFYESCGYTLVISTEDQILVVSAFETVIGVVRLCKENGVRVLRGMQVGEIYRGNTIGSKILEVFEKKLKEIEADCYCIPYAHLERFYGQIGFKVIPESEAPSHLQKRVQENRLSNPQNKYLIMKRAAAT